jgi:geranylgeranyl diphosphate synthase, type III
MMHNMDSPVLSSASASASALLPHQSDPLLLEPFRYIASVPGKNVRGVLIDCFQHWLQVPDEPMSSSSSSICSNNNNYSISNTSTDLHSKDSNHDSSNSIKNMNQTNSSQNSVSILHRVKLIVADLHNASLLIDDIEDNSKLRRGIPVAHAIYGIPSVINCANYVYFLALEKCIALQNEQATRIFTGELLNLHRGQGYDIAWRDSYHCPTEEQYIQMVTDKTGGLFRLAVGLLQAFATSCQHVNYTPLVNNLAVYFQIRDDYVNLVDDVYHKSKSFCEDITEGKFSFPILHCIQTQKIISNQQDSRMLSILKQRTTDVDVKRYALTLLRETNSLSYTRNKCQSLRETIIAQIQELGGNPSLLSILQHLDSQLHLPVLGDEPQP